MSKKVRIVVTVGLLGLILLVTLTFLGCENKIKGTRRTNEPPVISFSNVPPDSFAFSLNPQVSWYAVDIDGYVKKYQYAVIIADSLHVVGKLWNGGGTLTAVDSACSVLVRIPPEAWVDSLRHIDSTMVPDSIAKFISAVDTTTSIVKVWLFSKENPSDFVTQHLFVRAIDNDDSTSNIIHRRFSRNNHLPKAHISYTPFRNDTDVKTLYSLPDTTQTWRGIKITWEGSDSSDYEGTQPDFIYRWELWGPFARVPSTDTFALTSTKYDELVADSSSHRLVASSFNEQNSTRFIRDKSLFIPFLDKRTGDSIFLVNFPHTVPTYSYPDDGYGWYLFIVWTIDDAFTSSDPFASNNSLAHLWFRIIHPQFTYQSEKNKVLVLNFGVGRTRGSGELHRDSVIAFFNRGFDSMKKSGLCDAFLIPDIDPSKINDAYGYSDTVSRWNLVVCLDEGGAPTIEGGKIASVLKDYMKVGGKVWFTGGGTEIFGYGTPPNTPMIFKNLVPPSSSLTRFLDYVTTYSSLLGVYRSGCGAYTTTQPKEYLGTSAEFVGAEPFDNSEISQLPSLKVDSIKVFNQAPNESLGAPRVAYAGCSYLGEATRIYTFISHPDDVNGSAMDGRPCGSVYKGPIGPEGAPFYGGPIYKTAYMSFPLHFIEEGENGEKRDSLFKAMLEWFWQ